MSSCSLACLLCPMCRQSGQGYCHSLLPLHGPDWFLNFSSRVRLKIQNVRLIVQISALTYMHWSAHLGQKGVLVTALLSWAHLARQWGISRLLSCLALVTFPHLGLPGLSFNRNWLLTGFPSLKQCFGPTATAEAILLELNPAMSGHFAKLRQSSLASLVCPQSSSPSHRQYSDLNLFLPLCPL